jgi:hypothetical protein
MEDNNMANRVYQYEQKRGQLNVIREYFEMPIGEMRDEGKKLSADEKLELAQGSAKALGLTADEVSFPID